MKKTTTDTPVTPDILCGRYQSMNSVVDDLEAYLALASEDQSYKIETVSCEQLTAAIIHNLTIIPIERALSDDQTPEDQQTVAQAFDRIVKLLAIHFHKPYTVVEHHVYSEMAKFPVEDVRIAHELKLLNKLH